MNTKNDMLPIDAFRKVPWKRRPGTLEGGAGGGKGQPQPAQAASTTEPAATAMAARQRRGPPGLTPTEPTRDQQQTLLTGAQGMRRGPPGLLNEGVPSEPQGSEQDSNSLSGPPGSRISRDKRKFATAAPKGKQAAHSAQGGATASGQPSGSFSGSSSGSSTLLTGVGGVTAESVYNPKINLGS